MPKFYRERPDRDNEASPDAYRVIPEDYDEDNTEQLRSPAIASVDHLLEVCDHPENWRYGDKDVYIEATVSLAETIRALKGQTLDGLLSTEEIEAANDLLANCNFNSGLTPEEKNTQCTTLAKDVLPRLIASDDITAPIDDRVVLIEKFSQRLHSSWQDMWHTTQGRTAEQRPSAPVSEKEVRKDMYDWVKAYWEEHPMRNFTPQQRMNNIRAIRALRKSRVLPVMRLAIMQSFSMDRYI